MTSDAPGCRLNSTGNRCSGVRRAPHICTSLTTVAERYKQTATNKELQTPSYPNFSITLGPPLPTHAAKPKSKSIPRNSCLQPNLTTARIQTNYAQKHGVDCMAQRKKSKRKRERKKWRARPGFTMILKRAAAFTHHNDRAASERVRGVTKQPPVHTLWGQ